MSFSSLQCLKCAAEFPATDLRYRCECGSLLEVRHDLAALRRAFPDLKERFARRLGTFKLPYASGVWRYHELILPDLPPVAIVSLYEGSTGLYRTPALSKAFGIERLYFKHEGENPTLSFKDRGMTAGVSWARHLGVKRVVCASTGDTSAAMAAYAAAAPDMQGIVFLPHNKISLEQLSQAISYGAKTLGLDTDFDGCMVLVQKIAAQYPLYLLNSLNSFRIEGQKAIGIETLHQLDWEVPDWFVIPVGNAGNISALGKGLLEMKELGLIDRLPRLAGIQSEKAAPFVHSFEKGFAGLVTVEAQPTVASAIRIGNPVSYEKARRVIEATSGLAVSVTEEEAMDAKAQVDARGVHICPNSAVAVAGMAKLRGNGTIKPGESVVVICTAHGAKFSDTGIKYHEGMLPGITSHYANPPAPLPATMEAIIQHLGL